VPVALGGYEPSHDKQRLEVQDEDGEKPAPLMRTAATKEGIIRLTPVPLGLAFMLRTPPTDR